MSLFHSSPISAKLVGCNLVASFATANPPLVWRFDLERNHSFTIALQGEAGDWELGITSPKGEFYPVAHFPAREDAEEALQKVQKVLMKKRRSWFWTLLRWVVGLVLVAGILFLVVSYVYMRSMSSAGLNGSSLGSVLGTATAPAAITPGVPLSADDVLMQPH